MPKNYYDSVLLEFNTLLSEINDDLDFLRSSLKIRPRLSSLLDWTNLDPAGKDLANSFISKKTPAVSPAYLGMLVTMLGGFEQFVRKFVETTVSEINRKITAFDRVPERVKEQNIHFTGRALCLLREPLDHIVINHEEMVAKLATCTSGSMSYKLNSAAFSISVRNLTPSHLTEIVKILGIEIDWDYFGRIPEYSTMFGTSGARATNRAIQDKLSHLVKLRNRVAHTGYAGITVTDQDLEGYLKFIKIFATDIAIYISTKISKMQ